MLAKIIFAPSAYTYFRFYIDHNFAFFIPILILSYLTEVAIYFYIGKKIVNLFGDNFVWNYFSGPTLPFNKGLEFYINQ